MPDSSSNQLPQATSPLVPSQPQPPQGSSGAPAASSDSRVVKAVLITVAVFIGLGVISVGVIGFGMWYITKSVQRVPSATFTESDLGIAIYPGAEPSMGGSRIEIAGKTMVNAIYFTRDSVDQVIAFYKEKGGPNARLHETKSGTQVRISAAAGNSIIVEIMRISDASGVRTRISILKATQAAAPR